MVRTGGLCNVIIRAEGGEKGNYGKEVTFREDKWVFRRTDRYDS